MRHLAMVWLAVITACGGEETLRVGFAVPGHWYRAVRLALEDHPEAPVTILWDTLPGLRGGAGGAVYWAAWHVERAASLVVGHDASRPSVGAAGVYNRAGVVQLAPVATSSLLEAQGRWSFGLVPNGRVEGQFMAAFADTSLNAQRVAVLYNNDEFGHDVRDGIVEELARRGIAVVDQRYVDPVASGAGLATLDLLFAATLRRAPDVILIAGRQAEVRGLMAFLATQPRSIPVVAADAALVLFPGRRALPPELEGAYVVRLWNPDTPAAHAFAARFMARWGEPPDDAEALTYDAARLALAAAADGARSPADVRRWLLRLGRDRPPFAGLAASYAFRDGRPFTTHLWMHQIRGGAVVPLRVAE